MFYCRLLEIISITGQINLICSTGSLRIYWRGYVNGNSVSPHLYFY